MKYCQWHTWFAWFPVRVGQNDCRWLERVERIAEDVTAGGMFFEFTPFWFRYRAMREVAS